MSIVYIISITHNNYKVNCSNKQTTLSRSAVNAFVVSEERDAGREGDLLNVGEVNEEVVVDREVEGGLTRPRLVVLRVEHVVTAGHTQERVTTPGKLHS